MKDQRIVFSFFFASRNVAFLFLALNAVNVFSQSQSKIEFEESIEESSVPQISIDFVNSIFPDLKVDWYLEKNEVDSTYEAKLKKNKKKYSIEFSDEGAFLDAEEEVSSKEIPKYIIDTIRSYLKNEYSKFELKKIQKQYLTKSDITQAVIDGGKKEAMKEIEINYEIIVFGETKEKQSFYEYLFDQKGIYIKRSEIELQNNDNLFY